MIDLHVGGEGYRGASGYRDGFCTVGSFSSNIAAEIVRGKVYDLLGDSGN